MPEKLMETAGRPISYELVLLNQLERIAVDIEDVPKTILNIEVFHHFTVIDHDEEYNKMIEEIDKKLDIAGSQAFDLVARRIRNDEKLKTNYQYSLKKLNAIMTCLRRSGRFPSKFGLIDESEFDEKGVNNDLSINSGDGKVENTAQ